MIKVIEGDAGQFTDSGGEAHKLFVQMSKREASDSLCASAGSPCAQAENLLQLVQTPFSPCVQEHSKMAAIRPPPPPVYCYHFRRPVNEYQVNHSNGGLPGVYNHIQSPLCQRCGPLPALIQCLEHNRSMCYDCFTEEDCVRLHHRVCVINLSTHALCHRLNAAIEAALAARAGRGAAGALAAGAVAAGRGAAGRGAASRGAAGRGAAGAGAAGAGAAVAGRAETYCLTCGNPNNAVYCHRVGRPVRPYGVNNSNGGFTAGPTRDLHSPLCHTCEVRPAFLQCLRENRTLCYTCFTLRRCAIDDHHLRMLDFSTHLRCDEPAPALVVPPGGGQGETQAGTSGHGQRLKRGRTG